MSTTTTVRRRGPRTVIGGVTAAAVLLALLTAPEPPGPGEGWRWATIGVAASTCAWNLDRAAAAFRVRGAVSLVAFLHLWLLAAFSLPAVEMTYRYDRLSLGHWQIWTDDPALLYAALLLAAFQVLFFLALGHRVDSTVAGLVDSSRTSRPDTRIGLTFLVLLLPLVLARLVVFRGLGVDGVATAMVTRTDYFAQLDSEVSSFVWALNTAFPVYGVAFGCLAVKHLVPHPSRLGGRLFVGVLAVCVPGVALSGGRAELVFVTVTVGFFMYVAGYRSLRQLGSLVVGGLLVAALLFAIAEARHGGENALTSAAGGAYVGEDYSTGDMTQMLGLGRFDAVVMILDRHLQSDALLGSSYAGALSGGLDETFLPRVATGWQLPAPSVSGDVLGPWMFGAPQGSAMPSAPGEGYLNFGLAGALGAAVVLGLVTRALVGAVGRLRAPQEFALLLVVWTMARLLSDESALIASFVVRNWPGILLVLLVTRGAAGAGHPYRRPEPSR